MLLNIFANDGATAGGGGVTPRKSEFSAEAHQRIRDKIAALQAADAAAARAVVVAEQYEPTRLGWAIPWRDLLVELGFARKNPIAPPARRSPAP